MHRIHLFSLTFLFFCSTSLLTPSAAERIVALSGDGTVRVLENPECEGSSCRWIDIDNNNRSIEVAATRNSLFQLHNTGLVWQWLGQPCESGICPHWRLIGNDQRTIAISGNDNNLFQLRANGEILRWLGTECSGPNCTSWELMDLLSDRASGLT